MSYKIRIQCFKVTPYLEAENRYVNFEQIIPVKDIEDYMITMADKAQSELTTQDHEKTVHQVRQKFWQQYIETANRRFDLFRNVSPSKENWIAGSSGIMGVGFNCVIARDRARVEVYIMRPLTVENKCMFDALYAMKAEIERDFGKSLQWERLDDKKASRIKSEIEGVNYFDEEDWPRMIQFMVDEMEKLISAFRERVNTVGRDAIGHMENV